jgi:integral membrane sensor domain MASE1
MDRQARRTDLAYASRLVVLAAAYIVTGRLGLAMNPVSGFASLVWAPTALSLSAILIGGCRLWPAVAIGAFVVNLSRGAPPLRLLEGGSRSAS